MKINFIVEDSGPLKYLGCATAAKNLFNELSKKNEISWNDKSFDYDIFILLDRDQCYTLKDLKVKK